VFPSRGGDTLSMRKEIIIIGLGAFIYVGAMIFELSFWGELSLFLLSYIIIAKHYDFVKHFLNT